MVLVGMPSAGTGIGGSSIGRSGVGELLELPPHAVNEAARHTASTMLFNDVLKFMLTLAYVYAVLAQCS